MARDFEEDPGVRLMRAYQAGDEGAFDEIVRRYAESVHALLTRFLGPSPEREDLVQEVFLRVLRSRQRYDASARFSTWLYRIAFNLAVNKVERARDPADPTAARGARPEQGHSSVEELLDSRAEDPGRELERGDVVRAVRRAIAELPESQRMALILAKYHEQPYGEIAVVLGSSEKAVKSLIHRARENLRQRLAPFLAELSP
jgi:RNA polymerase sigma-70 factor (ECF subfamily)